MIHMEQAGIPWAHVPVQKLGYLQTAGEVTFAAGESSVNFVINIVNDFCNERYSEYVQLTLSIPGSASIGGEEYYAKLRIDDDDFAYSECTHEFL